MSARPGLRGQGYQRKGGVAATQAHNERVRAAATTATPDARPSAVAVDRTDGRGSDRPVGRTHRLLVDLGVPVLASAVTTVVIEWWSR